MSTPAMSRPYVCPLCDGLGHETLVDDTLAADPCHVCDGTGTRPDRMVSDRENTRLWAEARTLNDIGWLTARWLDGELPGCFVQDCPPDEETGDIPRGLLAALNRAGYVTEVSQPAEAWTTSTFLPGVDYRQRAAVELLVDGEHLNALLAATEGTDLVVTVHRALPFKWMARTRHWSYDYEIPVTESRCDRDLSRQPIWLQVAGGLDHRAAGEQREECWFGRPQPRSGWKWTGREMGSRAAGRALANAWQVTVVDPEWGRTDLLWDTLAALVSD